MENKIYNKYLKYKLKYKLIGKGLIEEEKYDCIIAILGRSYKEDQFLYQKESIESVLNSFEGYNKYKIYFIDYYNVIPKRFLPEGNPEDNPESNETISYDIMINGKLIKIENICINFNDLLFEDLQIEYIIFDDSTYKSVEIGFWSNIKKSKCVKKIYTTFLKYIDFSKINDITHDPNGVQILITDSDFNGDIIEYSRFIKEGTYTDNEIRKLICKIKEIQFIGNFGVGGKLKFEKKDELQIEDHKPVYKPFIYKIKILKLLNDTYLINTTNALIDNKITYKSITYLYNNEDEQPLENLPNKCYNAQEFISYPLLSNVPTAFNKYCVIELEYPLV